MSSTRSQAAGKRLCPHCHAEAATTARFCPACGKDLTAQPVCSVCGAALTGGARFCPACGAALQVASAPAAPLRSARTPGPRPVLAGVGPRVAGFAGRIGQQEWWRTLLSMSNPGQRVTLAAANASWLLALGVSGAAFAIFFLQTGLDRLRYGQATLGGALALAALGALYGTLGILVIGLVAWGVARLMGVNLARGQVIRSLALSYAATLVYVVVGLFFNVFLRWNTAVAFGATGVLWALGPMIAAFRSLMDGKLEGAILMATVCGGLTLLGWVVLAAV